MVKPRSNYKEETVKRTGNSFGRNKSVKFKDRQVHQKSNVSSDMPKHVRWNSADGRPVRRRPSRSTLIKTGGDRWFDQLGEQEGLTGPVDVPKELIKDLRSKADKLLKDDIECYKQTHSYGDFAWIEKVLHGGTLADKMAAYTTLLQDSAVHNLASLDALLALVSTKAKRECIMATDTLKDLFTLTLLPENRKLRKFEMHPLSKLEELCSGNQTAVNRRLVLWYFEDLLKARYTMFLEALDKVLHDTVVKTKSKAITAVEQMLSSNPEQEQLLLSLLVNKLGDPEAQVAGKAIHGVTKLLDQHPNMKEVVAQEVERFLYRPHLKERAQYYALCCLNQVLLDKEDSDLALHLTKVYLGFFSGCVKKQRMKERKKKKKSEEGAKEVDLRLMSVTLTGLSRAAPFNKQNASYLSEHTDALFALLHKVPFNIRIQTLALLFQVDESGSERFYCALYRSLVDPGLQSSSRQAVYLNLLYRCLRKDPAPLRVMAFAKRIFQVCHYLPPSLACGLMILVGQVFQTRPEVALFKNTEKSSSSSSENFSFLLDNDDDGEEHYEDAPDEEDGEPSSLESKARTEPPAASKKSSWVHLKNAPNHREDTGIYQLQHRNPLYSLGGRSVPFWELLSLSKHFHPSVALFAKNLTLKKPSEYCGDPLQDFTLAHFLERFVYRNPKKSESQVESGFESKRPSVFGKRKHYIPAGLKKLSVNSSEYVQYAREQVPVEERFLYDYMVQVAKRKKLEKDQDDEDAQSVASDDFEMMLDKMEPGSMDKMDFATAMTGADGQKSKKKGKAEKEEADEDTDSDDDLEDDFEEDMSEEDFANDEDFQKAFEEYDDDLEDFAGEVFDKDGRVQKALKKPKSTKNKKAGTNLGDLFASAEQFSGMLEDENDFANSMARRNITAGAVANKDKAGPKQLEWEEKRQSSHWQNKRKGCNSFSKRKHAGTYRKHRNR